MDGFREAGIIICGKVMQPITVSANLTLTPLELQDSEELFKLTDANRDYLREWLPWLDRIKHIDDTRALIQAAQLQAVHNNGTQMAIRLHSCIVGIVGHRQIDWRRRLTSLGYWLAREFQGLGVVTTACNALVTDAFSDTRLNRVEIRCAVENHRSRAIPKRLGFRQDGVVRDAEWLYDHFVDHIVYRMLVHEWSVGTTESFVAHGGE